MVRDDFANMLRGKVGLNHVDMRRIFDCQLRNGQVVFF